MKTVRLSGPQASTSEDSIRLHDISKLVYKARKISVLTGAGISCNAGIPDFRSSDGLYNLVKSKYPQSFVKGQDLFDISLFRNDETLAIFCTFMEGLYKESLKAHATETHKFLRVLKEKNKLLRCYTQNIDSLERRVDLNCGINSADAEASGKGFRESWKNLDVVQLHGNLHKLLCTQCFAHFEWNVEIQKMLEQGENPECEKCHLKFQERLYSGKRITGNIGILRPDIVLYGENHPQSELISKGLNIDLSMKCELLLIMGTSLKVDGVKKLVRSLARSIHDRGGKVIVVNKTPVARTWANLIDFEVLGDCDDFVHALKTEVPDLFLTQEQLDSKKLEMRSKAQIKRESMTSMKVLTPPTTPTKQRVVLLPKPKLETKTIPISKMLLPQPSFCEDDLNSVKTEPGVVPVKEEYLGDSVKEVPLTSFSNLALNRRTYEDYESRKRMRVWS